jgi:hypothetical protein
MMLKIPESRHARKFVFKHLALLCIGGWMLFPLGLFLSMSAAKGYWDAHPQRLTIFLLGSGFGFFALVTPAYMFWIIRMLNRIQREEAKLK